MADIKVRIAKESDADRIVEIEKLCFHKPWTKAMIEGDLDNEMENVWVAEIDGKVVGYSIVWVIPTVNAELNRIGTDPAYRRQGVAHNLINYMLNYCNLIAVEKVLLEVRDGNTAAIELYKSFDFEVDGRRPKYYDGKDDAILMSRTVTIEGKNLQLEIEKEYGTY